MPTEYKQMLCTAHRVLDGEMYYDKTARGHKIKRWKHPDRKMNKHLYLAGHVNHPTNIWLRECTENYMLMFTYYKLIFVRSIHIGMVKNMVQKIIGGYYENHQRICLV